MYKFLEILAEKVSEKGAEKILTIAVTTVGVGMGAAIIIKSSKND